VSGILAGLGRRTAAHPWMALVLLVAAQTLPTLGVRDLWFADEVRHGNVLQHLREGGHWLVLYLNGAPYPDKPPLHFWLLGLLGAASGSDRPWVFLAGAALSTLALLAATMALARAVGGTDRRVALHAALLPLGSLYFVGTAHYARPDQLFAALITTSHLCLFRAWTGERGPRWAVAGFGLGGVAVMTKGPLGLLLPLLAGVTYLAWRHRLSRLARADVAAGLAVGLALPLAWLAAAWAVEGPGFLRAVLVTQIYRRATASFIHPGPPWHYVWTLPVVALPWTLLVLGRPWRARPAAGDAGHARPASREGRAYLAAAVVSGFAALSLISIKIEIYLLPLFPPLAVLAAGALERMGAADRRRAWTAVAVALLALGALMAASPGGLDVYVPRTAAMSAGAILGALGLVVIGLRRAGASAVLVAVALGLAVWANATLWVAEPALDAVMSPRAQAEVMRQYAAQGYLPIAHRIFPGIYSYYARTRVTETRRRAALRRVLARHERVVVAMRQRDWDRWAMRPPGLRIVHRQRIANSVTVLAVRSP
jgi:4-amino-4-deoxy-L-arabinose transferase-like glycosyltransferase